MTILYVMVHAPCFWWIKIGITGKSTRKRAAGINREMWGIPIPVVGIPIPFAKYHEAMLHRHCRRLNVRFYKGSGYSEWFWLPAIVPALIVMIGWVAVYVAAFYVAVFAIKNL